MKVLWIHYGVLDEYRGRAEYRFAVFEATADGRQTLISPPGRIQRQKDVLELLVSHGARREEATERVTHAIRNGIAHLSVGTPAASA